ncbi:AMP-dependent synthetase/ligase [Acididesulfobacillus acetoxydans]|uniref:AMP-dependent synthetase/ligase n=1 Tax=Acididesulfobacillus acetoxydans TaxID=1561005 RepID=A0A8S0WXY8_9FIRM|nr:long-chain fatty acid--CoA ligase [Acididesulfobacillus acetoxydans]CAA7601201.1 AMP-dependent synthetase/ligase [Acididesulfobacillus acetoxydans]CEJ08520.1 Long-chain-fatty-acid--CoA ligase [Acididesulfobacillus acetoxydans]
MVDVSDYSEQRPWLQHYDQEVEETLAYPEATLNDLFEQGVSQNSQKTALVFFGKCLTYAELLEYIRRLAGSLQERGIVRGDRVALLLPNCPQFVMSYYALLRLGATVVPINPLSTEPELLHIMRDGQVKAAISLDLWVERLENVRAVCREAGEGWLKDTYYTSLREFLPFSLQILYLLRQKMAPESKQRLAQAGRFSDLLHKEEILSERSQVDVHHEVAVLIYTGGTTGKPKGVMLSHYALVANARQCSSWAGMTSEDSILTVLPIFHGFGMSVCMNAPLLAGAAALLVPRFTVEDILKAIHRFRPTLFAGVPTMYVALINHRQLARYDLASLRGCFVGAAPLAPEVKRRFEELTGSRLMEGYGLTEAVTALCANPYRGVNKTGSIGIPFPDVVIQIRDLETGERELSPGETGELVIQAPELMLGYHRRPQETAGVLRDGWLFTGDLGYRDEEGYFYIVDRKKDMIITGGFNVYPREVEDVLYEHPAVREVSVIGVADAYKGEKVKAFIVFREGAQASQEEILSFCRQHLLPYKVPKEIEFRQELPKTAIGKILKRALRE